MNLQIQKNIKCFIFLCIPCKKISKERGILMNIDLESRNLNVKNLKNLIQLI